MRFMAWFGRFCTASGELRSAKCGSYNRRLRTYSVQRRLSSRAITTHVHVHLAHHTAMPARTDGVSVFNSRVKYSTYHPQDDGGMQSILNDIRGDFEPDKKDSAEKITNDNDGEHVVDYDARHAKTSQPTVDDTNRFVREKQYMRIIYENEKDIARQAQQTNSAGVEIEEMDDEEIEYEYVVERTPPIDMKRGKRGVFELEELIKVLEEENARDLIVIPVPEELKFVDNMVIVSGTSPRHLRAMAEWIQWIYKRKKSKTDPLLNIEGLDSKQWIAMDLGNIALHLFMPDAREQYDLETLWTQGANDATPIEDQDPYTLSEEEVQRIRQENAQSFRQGQYTDEDGDTGKKDM